VKFTRRPRPRHVATPSAPLPLQTMPIPVGGSVAGMVKQGVVRKRSERRWVAVVVECSVRPPSARRPPACCQPALPQFCGVEDARPAVLKEG